MNWRDLNACPISATDACDSESTAVWFPVPAIQSYTAAQQRWLFPLQQPAALLQGSGSSRTDRQINYTWSRSFDTGSANRGGAFLTDFQNPYNVNKDYAPSNFDTPWNFNFTLVYEIPRVQALPKFMGEGWSINSLFRAQEGRPFTVYVQADPSNQGLRETYADYDGSPLDYNYHIKNASDTFFNIAAFSPPAAGTLGNNTRNSLRQPGIAQLDMGMFKTFIWRALFRKIQVGSVQCSKSRHVCLSTLQVGARTFGTFFATPDVGLGVNPVLATGAPRNMQFGIAFAF